MEGPRADVKIKIFDRDLDPKNLFQFWIRPNSPSRHPNSSATRLATDIAATRRGCVSLMKPAPESQILVNKVKRMLMKMPILKPNVYNNSVTKI
uniref:Uncharacterized protein n=1 Tax=Romanomermis culicivorax TaxID=13658 RepID=A0A915JZX4_ROMCU